MNIKPVDLDTIQQLEKRYKLTKKDLCLLVEAYRRYHSFHQGTDIRKAWVGLGAPSVFRKSKYFKPVGDTITPRVDNWWLLTEEGVEFVEALSISLPWKPAYTTDLF
jgi:hypothetical protein